jgi:hypothetical protein
MRRLQRYAYNEGAAALCYTAHLYGLDLSVKETGCGSMSPLPIVFESKPLVRPAGFAKERAFRSGADDNHVIRPRWMTPNPVHLVMLVAAAT